MARHLEGKERRVPFTFTLAPAQITQPDNIARRENRSQTNIIEELIGGYLIPSEAKEANRRKKEK